MTKPKRNLENDIIYQILKESIKSEPNKARNIKLYPQPREIRSYCKHYKFPSGICVWEKTERNSGRIVLNFHYTPYKLNE